MSLNIHQAVYALAGIDSYKFDKLIQAEVDGAGGLLNRTAAAELAANKLGLHFTFNTAKHGEDVWIYTFVASRNNKGKRTD